jgi:hypothetical protein
MHQRRLRTGLTAGLLTAGLAISAVATTHTADAASAGCRVNYTIGSQWSGGFSANVAVTNLGDPVSGWTLRWSFGAGQAVTQAWNATVTQSGSAVSATNASWNGSLATNGSTSFGFNGSWNNSTNPVPSSFTLNGVTCTGSVTGSPSPSVSASPSPSTTSSPTTPPTRTVRVY